MKIAWLNNVQAPYREPMFREIARLVDLEVSFFFAEEKVRHWTWRPHEGYPSSVVPAWRVPVPARVERRLGEDVGVLRPGVTSRMLRGADALITQVWWQPANVWAMVRCRRRGIPYLIYAESTMDSRSVGGGPADRLRSWVFRNAGAVIVPGPAAAETAIRNGTPRGRVVESVNSVDTDLYGAGVQALRTDATDTGPHRFLYVGQLIERKNVATALRALAGLGGDPTLDVVGDGVEMEPLRRLAGKLGISDRVTFHGFLDEPSVLRMLAECRTLVLPSTEEVYGYTAIEAHVAGLQVVVSDVAGVARNLMAREGTWVVAPTDEDMTVAFGEAMAKWNGWNDGVGVDFASPQRAAQDIVAAVELACRRPDDRVGKR
jgi:glycosyltransferase involved in cell wall biosynthesis